MAELDLNPSLSRARARNRLTTVDYTEAQTDAHVPGRLFKGVAWPGNVAWNFLRARCPAAGPRTVVSVMLSIRLPGGVSCLVACSLPSKNSAKRQRKWGVKWKECNNISLGLPGGTKTHPSGPRGSVELFLFRRDI